MAVYVSSDGKQAIIGSMVDAKGADVTREPVTRLVSKPISEKTLKLLEQSAWIGAGAKTAPRAVYTFTDPNCPLLQQVLERSAALDKSRQGSSAACHRGHLGANQSW